MTLNFNDLPCDIKKMIFKINKDRDRSEKTEIKNNKIKYNNVLSLIPDMFKNNNKIMMIYYYCEDDELLAENPEIFDELDLNLNYKFIKSLYNDKNLYLKNNYNKYEPYFINPSLYYFKGFKIC